MKNIMLTLLLLLICSSYAMAQDNRTFMFIGEPTAEAWQFMMDNPEDRKASVSTAFEKLGGKIISYYFGLGENKNYIICELPNDNELIQAVYLMRMPTGLLASYEIKELMPSEKMTAALKRSKELMASEKATSGGVPEKKN